MLTGVIPLINLITVNKDGASTSMQIGRKANSEVRWFYGKRTVRSAYKDDAFRDCDEISKMFDPVLHFCVAIFLIIILG